MAGSEIKLRDYFLSPGFIYLSEEPSLISTVVGSCVAVSLWDCKKECGAMAHFLYPSTDARAQASAKFGNVAIQYLIKLFLVEGSKVKDLRAQIFGGAISPTGGCERIGAENIRVAKRMLAGRRIPVISEDVGGTMGRKIVYNTAKNEAVVYKVNQLRKGDWYPYIQEGR
jgi:chemotaxis protein CheD